MKVSFSHIMVLMIVALSLAVVPVQAEQSNSMMEDRQEMMDERQEQREEKRVELQERMEENKEVRQEIRSNVAQVHAERLQIRFAGYYERLNKLMAKIQTRINQMSAEGKNVSTAQQKMNEAKTALTSAKTYGDQSLAKFKSIQPENYEAQRAIALEARDLAEKAREQFFQTLKLMKEVVAQLRLVTQE